MAGERAYKAAMKLKTEKWLLAEARYQGHKVRPDGRSKLGYPEVAWSVSALLFALELHWQDLPEQVRYNAMKACKCITNYEPPAPGTYRR